MIEDFFAYFFDDLNYVKDKFEPRGCFKGDKLVCLHRFLHYFFSILLRKWRFWVYKSKVILGA